MRERRRAGTSGRRAARGVRLAPPVPGSSDGAGGTPAGARGPWPVRAALRLVGDGAPGGTVASLL
jgi:hypothetical protein